MKKIFTLIAIVMLLGLALLCISCRQGTPETIESTNEETEQADSGITDTDATTETEASTETGKVDRLELSDINSPVIAEDKEEKATVVSTGTNEPASVVISFNEAEENYTFASFDFTGRHDSFNCGNCKYVEKNGTHAFYMHSDPSAHIGLAVDLKTPIEAAYVSAITVTVMTDKEITKSSQIRLFKRYEANTANPLNHNGYPDLAGATEEWKTIDFNLNASQIASLADEDGLIRGFKMMLRDNDGTGAYIQNITFHMSIEGLCRVDSIEENVFYKGGALKAIAKKIAQNLNEAGIGAEIEVKAMRYISNTSAKEGKIVYDVSVKTSYGREYVYSEITTTISKIEGSWLNLSGGSYGGTRDSKNQWQTTFDDSGIITLEDNMIKVSEGIYSIEYSIIEKDTPVESSAVEWSVPHILEMSDNGFAKLFINAALDYRMEEGGEYRLVIRGITKNENYILHLDIPFVYRVLAKEPIEALDAALQIVQLSEIIFTADKENKVEYVRNEMIKLINNEKINVNVSFVADGLLSSVYKISLSYHAEVASSRYPAYVLGDESRTDFFAFVGREYTVPDMKITYVEQYSDIVLVAPLDGQRDLRIASDDVVKFWNTPSALLVTNAYEYGSGEACDPRPVRLEWTDKRGLGKTYIVRVSEHEDLKDAWVFSTEETHLDVYNLKAGQRYYWRVESEDVVSAVITFVTEAEYTRYILTDNVSNFRDIGGYKTLDGKMVKQGLAYRLSNFDTVSPMDRELITQRLGIKTDLDLRGVTSVSPLGNGVVAYPISISWHNGIFAEGQGEFIRQVMALFADEKNYPMAYHCLVGRDRTGTITILLLGLLGVDEDTILKEYMVTLNSVSGSQDGTTAAMLYAGYQNMMKALDQFGTPNDTVHQKIEAYLLSIGVTQAEIDHIRTILLTE